MTRRAKLAPLRPSRTEALLEANLLLMIHGLISREQGEEIKATIEREDASRKFLSGDSAISGDTGEEHETD